MTMGCPAPTDMSVRQLLNWRLTNHSRRWSRKIVGPGRTGSFCETESPRNVFEAASTKSHQYDCLSKNNTIGHADMGRTNFMDHKSRQSTAGNLEILRVGEIVFCSFFILQIITQFLEASYSTSQAGQSTTYVLFSTLDKNKTIKDMCI